MSALQVVMVIVFVIGVASAVWIVRLKWIDRRRGETTGEAGEEFRRHWRGNGMNQHW